MTLLLNAVHLALNFVRERTPESCTRLCAVLCCLTGCGVAVSTVCFAFGNPSRPATVGALVGVTSALIAAGCVALLTRTRHAAGCPPKAGWCRRQAAEAVTLSNEGGPS
jgi:hypothetical protein